MKKIALLLFLGSVLFLGCTKDQPDVHHPDTSAKVDGSWMLKIRQGAYSGDTLLIHPSEVLELKDLTYRRYTKDGVSATGTYKLSVEKTPKTHVDMQVLVFDNKPETKVFVEVLNDELVFDYSQIATDVGQAIFARGEVTILK